VADWIGIIEAEKLIVGEVLEITCHGEDLLLYRTADGQCHAASAYCPHMKNYMPNGLPPGVETGALLVDDELVCPFHGWHFDRGGRCSLAPVGQRLPVAVRAGRQVLRQWSVREHEGQIQLGGEIEDPG
jgi:nitrite reductase/ring-hydroxylating ferredoxin subunit